MTNRYIGHESCGQCISRPIYQCEPCGHTTCSNHYYGADENADTCGKCGRIIRDCVELETIAPVVGPVHPADNTWTPHHRTSMSYSMNGTNNGGGENVTLPSLSLMPQTPTPASRNYLITRNLRDSNTDIGAGTTARYLPPALRSDPPPVRPESSMSNATFATQPPPPYTSGPNLPPYTTRPNGHYSFGPTELTHQVEALDPFRSPPPARYQATGAQLQTYLNNARGIGGRRPTIGTPPGAGPMRYGPRPTTNRGPGVGLLGYAPRPTTGNSPGMQAVYGPRSTTDVNPGVGVIGYVPRATTGSNLGVALVNHPAPAPPASTVSSANDSAVPDSRAHHYAQLIMSGATDDPTDPEYGNPARVHQLPANKRLPPPRRGEVAAAAGHGNTSAPRLSSRHPANIDGNAAAFLRMKVVSPPEWFVQLANGYMPTVEDVIAASPLIEACRVAAPSTAGVVGIKNIPYLTTKAEALAFLGKNSQICAMPPGTAFYAVHIIFDRLSGKTMDAFVEVETHREAALIVGQFTRRLEQGRHTKIGDRSVEVVMSSQAELMSNLFPAAKNVTWHGQKPMVSTEVEYLYPGIPSAGFQGFLAEEELTHMVKHADTPQRSPFAGRVHIRTYECLISTLHKYPWFAVNNVLLAERDRLFKTTLDSTIALIAELARLHNNKRIDTSKPTITTLKEVALAALTCPGFTESQKATFIKLLVQRGFHQMGSSRGMNVRFGGTDEYSDTWPFKVLVKQPGVTDEFMEFFAAFLRDATANNMTMADINARRAAGPDGTQGHFGFMRIDYSGAKTLGDAGRREQCKVEALLRTVLPPAAAVARSRASSHHS